MDDHEPSPSSLSFTIETFDDPETGQPTPYGRFSRNWQDEETPLSPVIASKEAIYSIPRHREARSDPWIAALLALLGQVGLAGRLCICVLRLKSCLLSVQLSGYKPCSRKYSERWASFMAAV